MRRFSIGIAALVLALAWTGRARAGVYSTLEPAFPLDKDFRKFQDQSLIPLKRIGTLEANQLWEKHFTLAGKALNLLKDGPVKGDEDPFTVEERLNMSACLLRMRNPKGAIEVLALPQL